MVNCERGGEPCTLHPMTTDKSRSFLLALAAFALGVLVMTAHFHSVDEVALFTTAVNLTTSGELHSNQLGYALWSIRPGEEVVMRGPDGDIFTKKSPLMIIALAPLVALGQSLPFLTTQQTALLFGPLALALTAVLFFWLGRELRFSQGAVLWGVVLLVVSTMLLPYAQTVFGEWLATIGLLLAVLSWVQLETHTRPWLPAPYPTTWGWC